MSSTLITVRELWILIPVSYDTKGRLTDDDDIPQSIFEYTI